MLYFSHNCSSEKKRPKSKIKSKPVNVSSLKCHWNDSTEEINCELKAELQNKTDPSVSLLTSKKKKKYEIKIWDIRNNISFFIFKDFDNFSKVEERITNVIKEIENKTCIIFQQQNDTISKKNGINFKKSNECKNMKIGMKQGNGPQGIYLTEECATSTRTIRSLLHQALGQLASVFR
uniref:Astacin domain-containing protein n=1 Tax=Parastrongyloides trichosuri TaxID=131310 RepID=A0A0N5A121_PARTI